MNEEKKYKTPYQVGWQDGYNKGYARCMLDHGMEDDWKKVWTPVTEKVPPLDEYVLLSFENYSVPVVGRFDTYTDHNGDERGEFYAMDDDEPISGDMYVNAWMELPECYGGEE